MPSQHLLGFNFQLKPQLLLWKLMWQLYQKAKQWKRLHWYVTSTFTGTKRKNWIISTCVIDIFLFSLLEKKCANQIYCLARGYYMNSYKFLITQPQWITACPNIWSRNLKSNPCYVAVNKIQWRILQIASLASQKAWTAHMRYLCQNPRIPQTSAGLCDKCMLAEDNEKWARKFHFSYRFKQQNTCMYWGYMNS